MSPERLQEIQDLYLEALALPPDEREALLTERCAEDPDLRAEVDSLLAANPSDSFLDVPVAQVKPLANQQEAPFPDDLRFGPYQVLREIGRGGMGTVYLAERADGQFEQQVALKIGRQGLGTEALHERFLQERQILARLHHPHIARLLDGGVAGNRQPYFAMEYIEGMPLTQFCDNRQLDLSERLRLFQNVCEAVQHAHQQLVVHRDLKPSNILVTNNGEVKLLDFGIAKLLADEGTHGDGGMPLTETGMRLLTPEYAAPEQILGEPVSTTTDVYALGVLLYELLTGHRPYQFVRRTPGAIEQAILEQEPSRPSNKVSQPETITLADGTTETITPEQISRARRTQPQRLQRRLEGDLDVITLKALRKESARRYPSAEAFVEDIKRYLEGLPVTARPDTPGYRLRKFVQRNRISVLAATLVIASLIGGLTTALWQNRVATQERDRAQTEAEKATAVKDFLVDLFEESNPNAAPGDTLSALDILARGRTRIDTALAAQPDVQAEVMSVIAGMYRSLGKDQEAGPLIEKALALRKDLHGRAHADVAQLMTALGAWHYANGDAVAADSLHREALAIRQQVLGPMHPRVAQSLVLLSSTNMGRGRVEDAATYADEALAIQRTSLGPDAPELAATLDMLALIQFNLSAPEEALPLMEEKLRIQRLHYSDDAPVVNYTRGNLAVILQELGRFSEAETHLADVLAFDLHVYGEAHPHTISTLRKLGGVQMRQGQFDEAEATFQEALRLSEQVFPAAHPSVSTLKFNLGSLFYDRGDYEAAVTQFRTTLPEDLEQFGGQSLVGTQTLRLLGQALAAQENYTEAEDALRQALAFSIASYGEDDTKTAYTRTLLADVLRQQNQLAEAEPLYLSAIQTPGLIPLDSAAVHLGLGLLRLEQGNTEAADTLLTTALSLEERENLPIQWSRAQAEWALGRCRLAQGQTDEARRLFEQAHAKMKAQRGANDRYAQAVQALLVAL